MNRMQIFIASGGKLLYEGQADAVFLPGAEGVCELLPRHMPLMTLLSGGVVSIRCGKDERKLTAEGGVAWNDKNSVSVLIFDDN